MKALNFYDSDIGSTADKLDMIQEDDEDAEA